METTVFNHPRSLFQIGRDDEPRPNPRPSNKNPQNFERNFRHYGPKNFSQKSKMSNFIVIFLEMIERSVLRLVEISRKW